MVSVCVRAGVCLCVCLASDGCLARLASIASFGVSRCGVCGCVWANAIDFDLSPESDFSVNE